MDPVSAPPSTNAPTSVLHVDDSLADRYRRRRSLEAAGFRVMDVGTGKAARTTIAVDPPDVVLLDVRLPDTNGFNLAREIKAEASATQRDIGVILISAYFVESEYRVKGLESGADAYLSEPTTDDELVATLRAVSRRVEQLKRARENERLLDASNQAKNDFLATVVHEVRQPIQAALAAIGVMKSRVDRRTGQRARDVVERQLLLITRIVEDLLDATRIMRGDFALQLEPHDLGEVLRRSLETMRATLTERQLQVVTAIPSAPVRVEADASRLQQVFVNLLSNAARYTPSGGTVEITVETSSGVAIVRMKDTGEGISPERLPRIFDLFVRGSQHSGGFGIGLAVVRALVGAHGGTVQAASGGSGTGSEFVVTLPLR
jgi:signal transduction histidine kinase